MTTDQPSPTTRLQTKRAIKTTDAKARVLDYFLLPQMLHRRAQSDRRPSETQAVPAVIMLRGHPKQTSRKHRRRSALDHELDFPRRMLLTRHSFSIRHTLRDWADARSTVSSCARWEDEMRRERTRYSDRYLFLRTMKPNRSIPAAPSSLSHQSPKVPRCHSRATCRIGG